MSGYFSGGRRKKPRYIVVISLIITILFVFIVFGHRWGGMFLLFELV